MNTFKTLKILLALLMTMALNAAWARVGPYYSYVEIHAEGGGVTSGGLQGPQSNPAIWADDSDEGAAPLSLADGAP